MQEAEQTKLFEFIEASKGKGASDEFLAVFLARRGWPADDVYAMLGTYWERATGVSVPQRAPGGESSRDAFLYLLSFSTLATWSSALGSLLFSLIDRWFPDPVVNGYVYDMRNAATWQMACAVVAFPIFLLVMRVILREAHKHPERLESSVRKWLTYIALLLTAGSMICDLIWFLDYFLTGELTMRFVLKAFTVLCICGAIFAYYLASLRWNRIVDMTGVKKRSFVFATGAAVVVIVSFLMGLNVAGTPSVQRTAQADRKRVEDLRAISYAVNGWRTQALAAGKSELLPRNLAQLVQRRGIRAAQTIDPQTRASYSYVPKSDSTYELCADFAGAEQEDDVQRTQFWHHGPGHTCFAVDASSRQPW